MILISYTWKETENFSNEGWEKRYHTELTPGSSQEIVKIVIVNVRDEELMNVMRKLFDATAFFGGN